MHARPSAFATTVLAALLAVLLGGCGSTVAAGRAAPASWGLVGPSAVEGARTAEDGKALSVDVRVPAGGGECYRALTGSVETVEAGTVHVRVTYEAPRGDSRTDCTGYTTATATFPLPEPVGEKKVLINSQYVFTPAGAVPPALRLCGSQGCDPVATSCTDGSYRQALVQADTPQHSSWRARGCDGRWLVLEISVPTGAACGDPGPDCSASVRTARWFYRSGPAGWTAVTTDGSAGCAGVHRTEPSFPAALCSALPALPDRG
ncbi:hypothetical protein [Kitasatospora sp. NPDC002040]|uniref:hypothetical protein n=1 Tax=Kitasatospora sp. NPDC002040 TaxID=3154661 RepID=UPI003321D80A